MSKSVKNEKEEIQAFPKALESLKYFCEDTPEYHIVAAGSLLGIALHQGISFPVGKVATLQLYPMDFEEFLMAKGETQLLAIMQEHNFEMLNRLNGDYPWQHKANYLKDYRRMVVSLLHELRTDRFL